MNLIIFCYGTQISHFSTVLSHFVILYVFFCYSELSHFSTMLSYFSELSYPVTVNSAILLHYSVILLQ
jgi:hypothetical protein